MRAAPERAGARWKRAIPGSDPRAAFARKMGAIPGRAGARQRHRKRRSGRMAVSAVRQWD